MYYLLESTTRKGQQRLKQHGKIWKDMNHTSPLQSDSIYMQSVKTSDCRWVKKQGDEDFRVIDTLDDPDEFLEEKGIF